MLRIDCPFCGERDHHEFTYGGDASIERSALDDRDMERWHDYLFLRRNPKGRHREFWQHLLGCRAWLIVERDTATHEIFGVEPAAKEGADG